MYTNLILCAGSKRHDNSVYSYAECIQVEYIKELLLSPDRIEKLIKEFVKINWNVGENGEFIDYGWRAENIDTARMIFDITQDNKKQGEGCISLQDWKFIKRI